MTRKYNIYLTYHKRRAFYFQLSYLPIKLNHNRWHQMRKWVHSGQTPSKLVLSLDLLSSPWNEDGAVRIRPSQWAVVASRGQGRLGSPVGYFFFFFVYVCHVFIHCYMHYNQENIGLNTDEIGTNYFLLAFYRELCPYLELELTFEDENRGKNVSAPNICI